MGLSLVDCILANVGVGAGAGKLERNAGIKPRDHKREQNITQFQKEM